MLDCVICSREQFSFSCALKVVIGLIGAELFETGDMQGDVEDTDAQNSRRIMLPSFR